MIRSSISWLFLLNTLIFFSCSEKRDRTYAVLDVVVENLIDEKEDYSLALDNSNDAVILMLEKFKAIELLNDKRKKDSLFFSIGMIKSSNVESDSYEDIRAEKKLLEMLEANELDYLISQSHSGTWDIEIIEERFDMGKDSKKIKLSFPIYSIKGDVALVYYNRITNSGILVLSRNDDAVWEVLETVNVQFISPRLEYVPNG